MLVISSRCVQSPPRRVILAAAVCTLFAGLPAAAQNGAASYPDRPIKIVVPFPPGGAADLYARLVGQKLAEAWGHRQPVVIDNKAGAGGVIGTEVVAKAPTDGSTFLMVTIGHAVNPFMYAKLPYDTRADFVPVGIVAKVPSLVVVGPALKGESLKEVIAKAKAKPRTLTYASSGVGTTSHVGAALLESMTGVEMVHVPYKGAAPALQDVMGDRVNLSVDIITSSLPHVKGGKLAALGISSAQRSPQLPDVPTVAEAGVPGFEFVSWYMLLAPAKTPQPVLEKVNAELRKLAGDPDFRSRIATTGGEVEAMSLAQVDDYLKGEFNRWARVVRERNIKAD